MCDFIDKDGVNKVSTSIPNCHSRNKFEIEGFWFEFKSFCYTIFTNFPKKLAVVVINREEPKL